MQANILLIYDNVCTVQELQWDEARVQRELAETKVFLQTMSPNPAQ